MLGEGSSLPKGSSSFINMLPTIPVGSADEDHLAALLIDLSLGLNGFLLCTSRGPWQSGSVTETDYRLISGGYRWIFGTHVASGLLDMDG